MSKLPDAGPGLFTQEELEVIHAIDAGNLYRACLANLTMTPLLTHPQNVQIGETIHRGQKLVVTLENKELISTVKNAVDLLAGELALGNSGLVVGQVKKLANQVPLTEQGLCDALQTACVGLIKSARIYNPWYNREQTPGNFEDAAHLSTIAIQYINGELKNAAPETSSPIVVKQRAYNQARAYRRKYGLRQQIGEPLDHLSIAKEMAKEDGLKADDRTLQHFAKRLQKALDASYVVSLDELHEVGIQIDDMDEPQPIKFELGELVSDATFPDPEEIVEKQELKRTLRRALNQWTTPREKEVLEVRFGLKDGQDHTLEETARNFGVLPERIRQIQEKAFRKIRKHANSRDLLRFLWD